MHTTYTAEQLDLLSDYRTDHHNHNPSLFVSILSQIERRFHRPAAPYHEKPYPPTLKE